MSSPTTSLDSRFSDPGAEPTSWDDTVRALESAELFWITTVRADGRPHVTPLVAVWLDGAIHFCTGDTEQKALNLRTNPHVLLTDYRLPAGSTGRNVVELVRRRWDVPGVIITGDTAPDRLREAKSLGCRLLHKPIEPAELVQALGEVLPGTHSSRM